MTSGVASLLALLFQSVIAQSAVAAPGAGPEATSASTKARLELRGAGDCIAAGDLAARVAARTQRIQFVQDAPIYARVNLTSMRPGNVVAEVVLAMPGFEPQPRRFAAKTCAEAADAIALIIAVTLDPTLKLTGADTARPSPSPVEGGADRAPTAEKPAEQPPVVKPPESPPVIEAAPSPAAAQARREFAVSVAGQTIFGPGPAVMPGIALSGMAALDWEGIWSPALFLGATRVWRNDLAETGGNASFTLYAATLDACPLRIRAAWLVARPCAAALVGRLNASGTNTEQPDSAARPFATAGVALAASAGTTVEVSARVGVGVTLLRDAYEFGGATFHRASPITTSVSMGIGLHWP
jgi:hypothetical protein